jgi:hypothetical protein
MYHNHMNMPFCEGSTWYEPPTWPRLHLTIVGWLVLLVLALHHSRVDWCILWKYITYYITFGTTISTHDLSIFLFKYHCPCAILYHIISPGAKSPLWHKLWAWIWLNSTWLLFWQYVMLEWAEAFGLNVYYNYDLRTSHHISWYMCMD